MMRQKVSLFSLKANYKVIIYEISIIRIFSVHIFSNFKNIWHENSMSFIENKKNYDIQKSDDIRGTRCVTTFKRRDLPSIQTRTRSQVFYDLSMKHNNITALRIKFSVLILKINCIHEGEWKRKMKTQKVLNLNRWEGNKELWKIVPVSAGFHL